MLAYYVWDLVGEIHVLFRVERAPKAVNPAGPPSKKKRPSFNANSKGEMLRLFRITRFRDVCANAGS